MSDDNQPNKGPCDGLTVVDMSSLVSGPLCGRIFADLGAEVIKVESKFSDAAMRANPPVYKGHGAYYEQNNFGKKSLCVDPKSDHGREVIIELCRNADVFLQNSRPGVMDRLGFGYETLRKLNPKIIYVSVSGFGEDGLFANHAAYDNAVQGIVGFMPAQGSVDDPKAIRAPVADKISAISAANATLAALYARERNGKGQKISVNMVAAYASYMLLEEMNNETFRSTDLEPVQHIFGSYQPLDTADGKVIGLILQSHQFEAFCKAIGREDLQKDPRFDTTAKLLGNTGALYDLIADDVRKMNTEDFLEHMYEGGIPFSKVHTTKEFMESEFAKETASYVDIEDPELGVLRHLNYPAKFSETPADVSRRAPKLGEHNQQILEKLGLSDQ